MPLSIGRDRPWSMVLGQGLLAVVIGLGLVLGACSPAPDLGRSPDAQVLRVMSGDTLEIQRVDQPSSIPEQVRLLGIEAPDLGQVPWGPDAQTQLGELVAGQVVRLEFGQPGRDRSNRLLAYVWQGDVLINATLLNKGLALVSQQANGSPYERQLRHAQGHARTLGLGIWDDTQPMRLSPAQFRETNAL